MAKTDLPPFEDPQTAAVTLDVPPPGIQRITDDRAFFGHPRGLATLFFTEMWERFSYYGIRPLLVLFMTAALARGGFGFARPTASAIVGIYAASVYLASLPGGWVADRCWDCGARSGGGACSSPSAISPSRSRWCSPIRRSSSASS
jgi:POT family proton-dependent oligopeptide transporter